MRRLLISGADSAFFGLLLDLADSIAGVGGRQLVDIGVFDFGLTEEEREILARREIRVARPENKARFLTGKVPEVATVLATIGKLSLPEHFRAMTPTFGAMPTYGSNAPTVWTGSAKWRKMARWASCRNLIGAMYRTTPRER